MRFSIFGLLASTAAVATAQLLVEEENPKVENTYFNSIKVPPLLEPSPLLLPPPL